MSKVILRTVYDIDYNFLSIIIVDGKRIDSFINRNRALARIKSEWPENIIAEEEPFEAQRKGKHVARW